MPLLVIKSPKKMQQFAESARLGSKTIGLVPTMGALHQGHIRLVEIAGRKADIVVVSIFVNPAQFGPNEDYSKYPREFKSDCEKLEKAGAQVVFYPSAEDMYPTEYQTYIDVKKMAGILEGARRPGHFKGVATICAKLFNIIRPHLAVFGRKDGQQLAIMRRMARDLNFDIEIIGAPTIRTKDGIALSSRHAYLSREQLQQATVIKKSLERAEKLAGEGIRDSGIIEAAMREMISKTPDAKVDYIAFNSWDNLERMEILSGKVMISLVVVIGGVRLLDNTIINFK